MIERMIERVGQVRLFFNEQEIGRVQSIGKEEIDRMVSESFREAEAATPRLEELNNQELKGLLLDKDY